MNETRDQVTPAADAATASDTSPRGRLEAFYLDRLARFVGLAATADTPAMRALARHATLATYRDCIALGLRDTAQRVLDEAAGSEVVDPAA